MEEKTWQKPLRAKLESRCPGCLCQIVPKHPIYLVKDQWLCRDCYYAARRAGAV